jgi:hypothetical protein
VYHFSFFISDPFAMKSFHKPFICKNSFLMQCPFYPWVVKEREKHILLTVDSWWCCWPLWSWWIWVICMLLCNAKYGNRTFLKCNTVRSTSESKCFLWLDFANLRFAHVCWIYTFWTKRRNGKHFPHFRLGTCCLLDSHLLVCMHLWTVHTVSFVDLPEFMMCKDSSFRESEILLMVTVPHSLTSHSALLSWTRSISLRAAWHLQPAQRIKQ